MVMVSVAKVVIYKKNIQEAQKNVTQRSAGMKGNDDY